MSELDIEFVPVAWMDQLPRFRNRLAGVNDHCFGDLQVRFRDIADGFPSVEAFGDERVAVLSKPKLFELRSQSCHCEIEAMIIRFEGDNIERVCRDQDDCIYPFASTGEGGKEVVVE